MIIYLHFLYHIKLSAVDLTPYNNIFIEKLKNSIFPYDLFILSEYLLKNDDNKLTVENILNSKINIWDTGNWSENFWRLIKSNNLNIEKPKYYSIEDLSTKKYNISEFLEAKLANNELGKKPILMINWEIINYEDEKLVEMLNELNIKQIDITSKNESVNLYGKRGIDGLIKITTN